MTIEWVETKYCRLALGDCRELLPTLAAGSVDAVVTDPPYGFLNGSSGRGCGKLKNRKLNIGNTGWDIAPSDDLIASVISKGKEAIIWGGNYFSLPPCRGILVWDKEQPWPNFSAAELAWTTFNRPCSMYRISSRFCEKGNDNDHPTTKPLELMEWCLAFLPECITILDPFMGSGTTAIACIRTGRKFIGCEIDPKYFQIALKRIREEEAKPDLFAALKEEPKAKAGDLFASLKEST